jgi:hypothetical protein
MSNGAAAAGAAAAAATAQAIKASGAVVSVTPDAFRSILSRADKPLVIESRGGLFRRKFQYLTSYKGFVFHAKCDEPMQFSMSVDRIAAEKIWIPN